MATPPPTSESPVSASAEPERSETVEEPAEISLSLAYAVADNNTSNRIARMSVLLVENVGEQEAIDHDCLIAGRARRRDARRVTAKVAVIEEHLSVRCRQPASRRMVEPEVGRVKIVE